MRSLLEFLLQTATLNSVEEMVQVPMWNSTLGAQAIRPTCIHDVVYCKVEVTATLDVLLNTDCIPGSRFVF